MDTLAPYNTLSKMQKRKINSVQYAVLEKMEKGKRYRFCDLGAAVPTLRVLMRNNFIKSNVTLSEIHHGFKFIDALFWR